MVTYFNDVNDQFGGTTVETFYARFLVVFYKKDKALGFVLRT